MMQTIHSLFDHLTDGVCLADGSGNVLYMNAAASRLLAPEGAARLGNICELLCAKLDVGGDHAARNCPLRGRSSQPKSVTHIGRHGPRSSYNWRDDKIKRAERWQDLRVRCLRTRLPMAGLPDEELHVVLIEDATPEMELKRHRADWRNMIAHDLRTPLTVVYSALKLLAEIHPEAKQPGDEDAKLVDMSLKNCKRMMELLDLYLDVAQFDAGARQVKLEDVDLRTLVEDAVAEQAVLASSLGVTLEIDVPSELKARADAELLGRVAENLINNAIKYNVKGGNLKIGALRADEGVRLIFKDSGRGIDSKDLPFVFDRYFQAEARRAGRIQGNGLGLTFCKEALDLIGSEIAVSSEPGKGTEFTVTLRPATATGAPDKPAAAPGGRS